MIQNKINCVWNDNNINLKKNNMESELNEDLFNGNFKKDFYEIQIFHLKLIYKKYFFSSIIS